MPDPATSGVAPYRIFNIGNEEKVELLRYVEILERKLGRKAIREMLPLQAGDVPNTEASVQALTGLTGFRPEVDIEEGVGNFVDWYLDYYK
jgi:UDP-glucuronate 4-epimerase